MLALHCCKYYPMAKLRAVNWCCIMPCNVRVLVAECCKYRAILRQILRSLEVRAFTQGWFYTQIPSCAGVFAQGCFYTKNFCTQMRGYLYTQIPLHSGAFTEECFYTHVRLHRASFDTNELLHTEYFRVNTLKHRCSLHRQTYVQRRLFRHIYFYKKPERGFYTQVLLDQDASRKRHSYMGGWKHDLGQGSSHSGIKFPAILLLPRDAFTYKVFYTGRGLHTEMIWCREFTKGA